jgi:hypothetical protein
MPQARSIPLRARQQYYLYSGFMQHVSYAHSLLSLTTNLALYFRVRQEAKLKVEHRKVLYLGWFLT